MAREKAGIVSLISAVAANRKQFFALTQSIEREASCDIDDLTLLRVIDEHYPGRDGVTKSEACDILMACTLTPRRKSRC